jgi:hypothetical protein
VCGARAYAWHHRTYKRIGGNERVGLDIVPVCDLHHKEIHMMGKGIGLWAASKMVRRKFTKKHFKSKKFPNESPTSGQQLGIVEFMRINHPAVYQKHFRTRN